MDQQTQDLFTHLQTLIQQQSAKIDELETKLNIIPQLQEEINTLKIQNESLQLQINENKIQNQIQSTTSTTLPSTTMVNDDLTSPILPLSDTNDTTHTTNTAPRKMTIENEKYLKCIELQPNQQLTNESLYHMLEQFQQHYNLRIDNDIINRNDIATWIEYLYLNMMKMIHHINTSNTLFTNELKYYKEWFYYIESGLSSQYDILSKIYGPGRKRSNYISYSKWLELKKLFPTIWSLPPNHETMLPSIDRNYGSSPTVSSIFKTTQQKYDDDLLSQQSALLLYEQQRLLIEHEKRKNDELLAAQQRQKELLLTTTTLQQPFLSRSNLILQLNTSLPPDETILDLQMQAIGINFDDTPSISNKTTQIQSNQQGTDKNTINNDGKNQNENGKVQTNELASPISTTTNTMGE